jgi:hypothetical protein
MFLELNNNKKTILNIKYKTLLLEYNKIYIKEKLANLNNLKMISLIIWIDYFITKYNNKEI